jgi:hypothetical protein
VSALLKPGRARPERVDRIDSILTQQENAWRACVADAKAPAVRSIMRIASTSRSWGWAYRWPTTAKRQRGYRQCCGATMIGGWGSGEMTAGEGD